MRSGVYVTAHVVKGRVDIKFSAIKINRCARGAYETSIIVHVHSDVYVTHLLNHGCCIIINYSSAYNR